MFETDNLEETLATEGCCSLEILINLVMGGLFIWVASIFLLDAFDVMIGWVMEWIVDLFSDAKG